ncbi:S41 family peptidase [Alkalihalobacillus hemicellulosilyticus]|uniref:Peptidase S41 n=1 Tax=Halalkalibacter hemicellulosilyticusJCM 9152 TaxID=1236971 RepID=W4QE79_9BACI|nr:S41 family peptidase [Halalkalibacter hemicellulosilyticus]GAE29958.1 peptidase S41 [Halalkalibacter hemicellulosilyticusJCM 9152]
MISLEDRLFLLSKAYAIISKYFAHWEDGRITEDQLDDTYQHYLSKTVHMKDSSEFMKLMLEFLALFNNKHTVYFDRSLAPAICWERLEEAMPLGFSMKLINDDWIVVDSVVKEIRPGDIVMKVNDETIKSWIETLKGYFPELNASSQVARAQLFWTLLYPRDEYLIELVDQFGQVKRVRVDPKEGYRKQSEPISQWLTKGEMAYLKIPSFAKQSYEAQVLDELSEFCHAKAIIMDLRGNQGGSTPAKLVEKLMNQKWRWWSIETTLPIPDNVDLACYYEPARHAYDGDVIFLVDGETASAAEDLIVPFKDNHRAMIIGETTAGSTGQPYHYETERYFLCVGAMRARMPNGDPFEGIGIEPDIKVQLTREDLYEQRDTCLATAIHYHKQLTNS